MSKYMNIDIRKRPGWYILVNAKSIYFSQGLLNALINICTARLKISAIIILREYSKAKQMELGLAEAKGIVEYIMENRQELLDQL